MLQSSDTERKIRGTQSVEVEKKSVEERKVKATVWEINVR